MNRRDAAGLLTLAGITALWASASGAVLDYLRPGMRVWVGVAGAVLLVLGALELWGSRRESVPSDHGSSRVGWIIAVPICVAVTVGSGSLGVYAVGRNATFRDLPDAPTSFDLEQYVRASSFGGQPVTLTLVDLVSAARSDAGREVLEGHPLEVVGFLSRDDDGNVLLTRFVISCCAADGAAVQIALSSDEPLPKDGTWLRVVGTLGPPRPTEGDDPAPPVLDLSESQTIQEPDLPYEVPVSRIR